LSILDEVEQIRAMDPSNMYNSIFDFPEQVAEAIKIGKLWRFDTSEFLGIKNIVITGMGGSAIGGDILRSYLRSTLLIPVEICRHYVLPEYVDDESLVIVSSYSGNTEETVAAANDALDRKSMMAVLSTGGELGDLAKLNELPMAKLPTGLQPRAALGYSLIPMIYFFEKIGLIKKVTKQFDSVVSSLQKFREKYIEDSPAISNPAKLLAESIQNKIVLIYSGPTLTDTVGMRWKGQICENAKTLAFNNQFAEFNHNELVGWSDLISMHKDHLAVIILRDQNDHPQIRKRMNIVKDIIQSHEVEVTDVHSRGQSPLERILSLVQMGDFVSYYLAILNKVDPTPVKIIEGLKQALQNQQ